MIFKSKEEIRNFVWNEMKKNGICKFPCFGHIPNFKDVERTIEKIIGLEEYKNSKRIFISPDTPQRILIKFAIKEKEIYMATPKLKNGFCKVKIFGNLYEILKNSEKIFEIPKIDFALIGSVAVDLKGNRIGKGGGYGDREIKILREKNKNVIVATNVHEIQVFEDFSYLMKEHDEKVNIIITPKRVIKLFNNF